MCSQKLWEARFGLRMAVLALSIQQRSKLDIKSVFSEPGPTHLSGDKALGGIHTVELALLLATGHCECPWVFSSLC